MALGKDRVEMRAEDQVRLGRRPDAFAEHVADGIDAHVGQPELLENGFVRRGALLFLEWRRFDLAEADLFLDDLRLVPSH
jgi:hypothetical protein